MERASGEGWWQFIAAIGWLLGAIFGLIFLLQGTANGLEWFLREYTGIIISLGTLLLVGVLAVLTTQMTNKAAARRESFSQEMQALIKISEFRQNWIDDLRQDFVAITSYMISLPDGAKSIPITPEFAYSVNSLILRLNPDDQDFKETKELLVELIDVKNEGSVGSRSAKVVNIAHRLLKREWERLKSDLNEVARLEDAL